MSETQEQNEPDKSPEPQELEYPLQASDLEYQPQKPTYKITCYNCGYVNVVGQEKIEVVD